MTFQYRSLYVLMITARVVSRKSTHHMTSTRLRRAPGALVTVALIMACASSLPAQQTIIIEDPNVALETVTRELQAQLEKATTQPAPSTSPTTNLSATQPTTAETQKQQRLAKFMQLKFDRRLPTALAAMAATQPVEDEQ